MLRILVFFLGVLWPFLVVKANHAELFQRMANFPVNNEYLLGNFIQAFDSLEGTPFFRHPVNKLN